jgi:hypothetical protein
VIEHDPRGVRAATLDHLRHEREQPVVGDFLVIERREQEHRRGADLPGVTGEGDGVAQRAGAGAGDQPLRRNPPLDMRVDDPPPLVERQRIRLAGRAEDGETVRAFGEESLRVPDLPCLVDAAVRA